MNTLMKSISASLLFSTAISPAVAQPDVVEVSSGLFLSRYVASVAPIARPSVALEVVEVRAPQVREADELLEVVSVGLDEALAEDLEKALVDAGDPSR